MKFCGSCGKQIPDDANACPYCGAFQEFGAMSAPEKKPFPAKKLAIALAALVVVLAVVFAAVKLIGGAGWKKPLDRLCDIANDQKVSESVIKDAARCVAGSVGKKDVDAFIDEAAGVKFDSDRTILEMLQNEVDSALDYAEDEYGKNLKFSYEIEDKEKLDEDDLEEYQDVYKRIGSLGVDTVKYADDYVDEVEDYTDGELKKKDADSLLDHVKAFSRELKDAKVTAGYEVDLALKIEGKDDDDELEYTIAVIKLDGKWVIAPSTRDLDGLAEELEYMDAEEVWNWLF